MTRKLKQNKKHLRKVNGDISLKKYEVLDENEPQDLDYIDDGFVEFTKGENDKLALRTLRKMIRSGGRRLF
jgi:hypothetical protein